MRFCFSVMGIGHLLFACSGYSMRIRKYCVSLLLCFGFALRDVLGVSVCVEEYDRLDL